MPTLRSPLRLVLLFLVLALAGAGGFLAWCQRVPGPQAELSPAPRVLGRSASTELVLRAARAGLASVEVRLVQGDRAAVVASRAFADAALEQRVPLALDAAAAGLREGEARIEVVARDRFWRPFPLTGTTLVAPVVVDLTPPAVEVLSHTRYLTHGGSGVVVFRTRDAARAGVVAGGVEQAAFPAAGAAAGTYVALFALPWDSPEPVAVTVFAGDEAGNQASAAVPASVKYKPFPTDVIGLSDDLMARKVAELLPERRPSGPQEVLAAFLVINRDQRREGKESKLRLGRQTAAEPRWEGPFLQPPNTQVFANFAETRSYRYGGQEVDRQVHLGFDLASTQRAPVPAANAGTVAFAGWLTIYGNTVVLDHGLGLQTLYGHLSSLAVKEGESVAKGQELGRSGATGLAVGDHLHYEVLLHGIPVAPVEWWDAKWVRERIAEPVRDAGLALFAGSLGATPTAAPAVRPKAGAGGKPARKQGR